MVDRISDRPPAPVRPARPSRPPASPLIAPGQIIQAKAGRFRLGELFSKQGAMSRLFRVADDLGNSFLLKQPLVPDALSNDRKAEMTIRFMREIKVLQELNKFNDPRFVRLIDLDPADPPAFYIMEQVPNALELSGALVSWGELEPLLALQVMSRIVGALDRLSRSLAPQGNPADFAHRDIKPDNILLSVAESAIKRVILIDLGIMKLPNSKLTMIGDIIGTPGYLAPETISAGSSAADQRSDIFSLGCLLYELMTGKKSFDHSTSWFDAAALDRFSHAKPLLLKGLIDFGYIDNGGILSDKILEGPRNFKIGLNLAAADLAQVYGLVNSAHWYTRLSRFGKDPLPPLKALYHNRPKLVPAEIWENIFRAMAPFPQDRFRSYAEFYAALSSLSVKLGGNDFPPLSGQLK